MLNNIYYNDAFIGRYVYVDTIVNYSSNGMNNK